MRVSYCRHTFSETIIIYITVLKFKMYILALTLMDQVTKKVRWLLDQVGSKYMEAKPKVTSTPAIEASASKLCSTEDADNSKCYFTYTSKIYAHIIGEST